MATKKTKNPWADYAIIDTQRHKFERLEGVWWDIRPLTTKDDVRIQREIQNRFRTVGSGDSAVQIGPTNSEIAMIDIAASFGGTNLKIENLDGFVLPEDPRFEDILKYLSGAPIPFVDELWRAVGKANPLGGPIPPQDQSSEDQKEE